MIQLLCYINILIFCINASLVVVKKTEKTGWYLISLNYICLYRRKILHFWTLINKNESTTASGWAATWQNSLSKKKHMQAVCVL